ncbi:MAG: sigma-70 family RNA polymerase sigma factor [Chloroflexi bacterium]|nr:sigma-70 family RNA polymerase sigma factor [Chloroflexota bacterium]
MVIGQAGQSDDPGLTIWKRLCQGDPVASSDFAEVYLPRLSRWLAQCYPHVPEDLRATAADDTIVALIKNPFQYRPELQTLEAYLHLSARGDLKNLLRHEQRHALRSIPLEDVELSGDSGKYLGDVTSDPSRQVEEGEMIEQVLPSVIAALTAEERVVLELMAQGERRTQVFAEALGIDGLSPADQRRRVKQLKDRLKKRLERAGSLARRRGEAVS